MLKWLVLNIVVICLKVRVNLRFYGFLSVFGTLARKRAKTLFVLHEIWHTTRFGLYYFVYVVRIEYHSHMLEITCLVLILSDFKPFWHFGTTLYILLY